MSPSKLALIPRRYHAKKQQQGSMLVISVFVISVMLFLAVTLQDILSQASRSVAWEVYGARGLNAANSGAEIALQKIFNLSGQTPLVYSGAGTGADPAIASLNLNSSAFVEAMLGCAVVVQISKFAVSDSRYYYAADHYRIQSTAHCQAGEYTTVRTVAVEGREIK